MGWAHPGLTMRGTMIGCATTVNLLPFGAFGAWEPASWAIAFTYTLRHVLFACQKHYEVVCSEMQDASNNEWSRCNKLRMQQRYKVTSRSQQHQGACTSLCDPLAEHKRGHLFLMRLHKL